MRHGLAAAPIIDSRARSRRHHPVSHGGGAWARAANEGWHGRRRAVPGRRGPDQHPGLGRAGPDAERREVSRLHDRRRLLAMALLILVGGVIGAGMIARGEPAGADARAYWAAVRIWLNGGDPYHPTGPFMPCVYAPWMLPLFAPWALLPWDVAWFIWRGGTILGLLWTIEWAYRRRPLETAV